MADPAASQSKSVKRLSCQTGFRIERTEQDPYRYLTGFGNRFDSEVLPNALPDGQNTAPQTQRYSLFTEQLNGWSVITKRQDIRHVWMYRVRPAVAHSRVEQCAQQNPNVSVVHFLSTLHY